MKGLFLALHTFFLSVMLRLLSERSVFWTTGTTGDGTNAISEAYTTEWHRSILTPRSGATNAPNTSQGVLRSVLNELAATGTASPVSVAAGGAVVAGYYYLNDAALNVTIPTPAANTRIDRIVLRASHGTTRTVRITRIAGTEGTGTPPALTQTAGTTWDIPLYQVSITTGGVITLTDERTLAQYATNHVKRDGDTMTGALTVGTGTGTVSISLDGAAGQDRRLIMRTAGLLRWIVRANPTAESGANAGSDFDFRSYADDGSTLLGTPLRIVRATGALLAGGVNQIWHAGNLAIRRQGGDATSWGGAGLGGTNNYTPTDVIIQTGYTQAAWGPTLTVTFPTAFSAAPVVIAYPRLGGGVQTSDVTSTDFELTGTAVGAVYWLAIGPA
jgi:hypothetical protein